MSDLPDLPGAVVKVKFLESFKDGTIFGPRNFRVDEIAEITPEEYNKAKRSGAVMENMGVKLPEPDWGENAPPSGSDPSAEDAEAINWVGNSEPILDLYAVKPEDFATAVPVDLPADEPELAPEPEPEVVEKPSRSGRRSKKAGKDGKA